MLGSSCWFQCLQGLECLSCLAVVAHLSVPFLGHCPLWLWLWGEVKQRCLQSVISCDQALWSPTHRCVLWALQVILLAYKLDDPQSLSHSDALICLICTLIRPAAGILGSQSWWPVLPSPVTLPRAAVVALQICGSSGPWSLCSCWHLLLLALVSSFWHAGLSPVIGSGILQHPQVGQGVELNGWIGEDIIRQGRPQSQGTGLSQRSALAPACM